MSNPLDQRIAAVQSHSLHKTLVDIRRGIEKESLRIQANGHLAQTRHPEALGAALTHPWITTDYSEALLEFITPASTRLSAPLEFLDELHRYTYQVLDNEKLWVNSMPCIMGDEQSIPIAQYGSSNIGRMKYVYRVGLWHRYGRAMQTIAGIHYNISFPKDFWQGLQRIDRDQRPLQDYISDQYFRLIRNFQRYVGLVIYLFGASPAVCPSFLKGRDHSLVWLNEKHSTLHLPYGTSLRMSNLGYQNDAQSDLDISYNSLPEYIASLRHAIETPHKPYEALGVKVNGEYRQLNTNILQIENEYYGSIRPKQTTQTGERPTVALEKRGVEYIEMRCVDLDPELPLGIGETQMRFLEMFALFCLLESEAPISKTEQNCINFNREAIVSEGRNPELKLHCGEHSVSFRSWAKDILQKITTLASLFDQAYHTKNYSTTAQLQMAKIDNPDNTPSANIIRTLHEKDLSFFQYAMQQAETHERYFRSRPLPKARWQMMQAQAKASHEEQRQMEQQDQMSFDEYLRQYFK